MSKITAFSVLASRRRPSRLGALLEGRKVKDARAVSPSERLLTALQLSDLCRELGKTCSPKR